MSPMKWIMLNILTQSSIIQIISFLNMKKNFNLYNTDCNVLISKLTWKW